MAVFQPAIFQMPRPFSMGSDVGWNLLYARWRPLHIGGPAYRDLTLFVKVGRFGEWQPADADRNDQRASLDDQIGVGS